MPSVPQDWGEQMVKMEQELEAAKARIKELEAELFEWRGCPYCHTDHGPNSTCPPHEVRPTGLDSAGWQYGLWRGRTRAAKLRAEKAEAERDAAIAQGSIWCERAGGEHIEVERLTSERDKAITELVTHLERDRKRDEALAKIAAEALAKSFYDYVPRLIRPGDCLWCRESTDRHLNWCPTFVAREVLKEE